MTTRTFVDKNGNTWEWEETPEVLKAVEELNKVRITTEDKVKIYE